MLAAGERCVCELAAELKESDALISHHLKQLREAGLVRTRRVGRWLHCSLEPAALESLASTLVALADEARAAEVSTPCACGAYPQPTEKIWP